MSKKKVLLLGSVPMSLSELQMAPAVIGAFVKKRGHDFDYKDINLRLFDYCDKKHDDYLDQTEFLQDKENLKKTNSIIDRWQNSILRDIDGKDILLINVFSTFSQIPALRILELCRVHVPHIKIIMGGIGSQKKILGGINQFNHTWVHELFSCVDNEIFGQLCLINGFIDDWQPNVGMDVLEKWLPVTPLSLYNKEFDFTPYEIDSYQWIKDEKRIPMLGSHGCVRQCSFCDVIKYFPRYSYIEADVLTKSIVNAYQDTGISRVQFMDSLVNGSMTNFLQLLKNLAQAREKGWLPENFSWSGTYICRPRSKMLDEIHRYLQGSGADNLVIGVETGSDRVRFEMEKKFTNDDLIYELQAFSRYGIKASALFFPSWPTETQEDFQETLDLFSRLSYYGQSATLDSVSLGANGFSLIDDTPIDKTRDQIGLHPGPVSWLWKCDSNPTLTFWESIRRRLVMAEWCETYGIKLENEHSFRQMLAFNLKQHRSAILNYSGYLPEMIDPLLYLPDTMRHRIKLKVINFSDKKANLTISIGNIMQHYSCDPGITSVYFDFERTMSISQKINLDFKFDNDHKSKWQTYDSGDYYDRNGLYLDDIWVDNCDITYWGWNQLVDLSWTQKTQLPSDYYHHLNLRCITSGMKLTIDIPQYYSIHKYINFRRAPLTADNLQTLNTKLYSRLREFLH